MIPNEAKGARRKALGMLEDLKAMDDTISAAEKALYDAQNYHAAVKHKRDQLLFFLTDLVNRCMDSFGSDDGK